MAVDLGTGVRYLGKIIYMGGFVMGDKPVRCRIPELLFRIGKTQEWLAYETNHSPQEMSNIINMRDGRVVSVKKGRKLARKLNCYIDDLYLWE